MHKFNQSIRNVWANVVFAMRTTWTISPRIFLSLASVKILQAFLPLTTAYLTGRLIDSAIAAIGGEVELALPVTILIMAALVRFLNLNLNEGSSYVTYKLKQLMAIYLGDEIIKKVASLDNYYYENGDFNKHVNKVQGNINVIAQTPIKTFDFMTSSAQMVIATAAILLIQPSIAILLAVSAIPLIAALRKASKERWKVLDVIDKDWRLRNALENNIFDIRRIGEIKLYGLTDYFRNRWTQLYSRTSSEQIEVERRGFLRTAAANLFEFAIHVSVLLWLLIEVVLRRTISIGDFEFFRQLIGNFSTASSNMAMDLQSLNESYMHLVSYKQLMAYEPKVKQPEQPVKLEEGKIPTIAFDKVSFRYPGMEENVINNLSLIIEPGDDVAIVGVNGAGKTTLIKLLLRLYDVDEGRILFDEVDIKNLSLDQLYSRVATLLQDFNYYSFLSARENVLVGDLNKSEVEDVQEAVQRAGMDERLKSLPEGYETILSRQFDSGADLSGGEWQRVALARAFLRNADILILDEPTASVDAEAEYDIFQKISETQENKTTIIVSHRFSTVRNARKIYVIDQGSIVEYGSHEELMQIDNGYYKRMFELQAEGYQ